MIGTLLEKLFVAVGADLSGISGEVQELDRLVDQASRNMRSRFEGVGETFMKVGSRMSIAGQGLSDTLSKPLLDFAVASSEAATESGKAMAQVQSALASMGPVAGKTADDLSKLAANLQATSTFDDDDILSKVTANLLTFGNVSGDVFDRAQQAAVNLSARLGQDLQSSAIQLGKALNDPVKGVTALQRVGVSFTESQKEQIKAMVAAGNAAGAQKMILGELEKQFGGAAQAQRDATPGADTIDAWRNFQETVGGAVNEVLPILTEMLTSVLNAFNSLSPEMQKVVIGAVALVAVLGPVMTVVGGIVTAIGALIPIVAGLVPVITAVGAAVTGFMLTPFGLVVAAVAAVVAAFVYWDKIEEVAARVGAAISAWYSEHVKPTVDAVMAAVKPLVDFFVNYFGAEIEGVIKIIGALLSGDFTAAWTAAKEMVSKMVNAIITVAKTIAPGVVDAVARMYQGVKSWIQDKLGAVFSWLEGKLKAVGQWFFELYDAVVGHSYIPDMVDEIGQNMARLDKLMVDPAKKATAATKDAFRKLASDVKGLMDELFPEQAKINGINDKIALLEKAKRQGLVSDETYNQASGRLSGQMRQAQDEAGTGNPILLPGQIINDELIKPFGDLAATLEPLPELVSASQQRLQELGDSIGNDLGDGIMGAIRDTLTGKGSLWDNLRDGLTKALDRAITDSLRALEVSIFGEGGLGGFLGRGLSSLLGGIAGGARAVGGPVLPGHAYDVGLGEKFIPSYPGRVLSRNDAMRAMGAGDGAGARREGDVHVHVTGPMSDRDARRTGLQAGRAARLELARNARIQPA